MIISLPSVCHDFWTVGKNWNNLKVYLKLANLIILRRAYCNCQASIITIRDDNQLCRDSG